VERRSVIWQGHLLQETELRLKWQEYEPQLKKDKLNLKTECNKAVAREGAYAQPEVGNFVSSNVTSSPPSAVSIPFPDTKESRADCPKWAPPVPSDKKVKSTVKRSTMFSDEGSVASSSISGSDKSGLSDQACEILVQQN